MTHLRSHEGTLSELYRPQWERAEQSHSDRERIAKTLAARHAASHHMGNRREIGVYYY